MRRFLFGAALAGAGWASVALAQPAPAAADPDIAALKVGVTTYADVVRDLGAPGTTRTLPDGGIAADYVRTWTTVDRASFTPMVGALVGHSVSRTGSYSLRFDPAGVLARVDVAPIGVECHDSAFHEVCVNVIGGRPAPP